MNEQGLFYSENALLPRIILMSSQNQINIIVEDKDKEYIYEQIFNRLFCKSIRIGIFGLGGKLAVENAYKEFSSSPLNNDISSINFFYLFDGDFDWYINPQEMLTDSKCFYLDMYNIEGYFIDQAAAEKFVKGRLECCDKNLKELFNFEQWFSKIIEQSAKLFFLYCYMKKNYPKKPTLSRPIGEFLDCKTGFERKDNAYKKLESEMLMLDSDMESKILEIKKIYIKKNGEDYCPLICGKFLISSLSYYIRNILKASSKKSTFRNTDLTWSLINDFDINKLSSLKNAVLLAMPS